MNHDGDEDEGVAVDMAEGTKSGMIVGEEVEIVMMIGGEVVVQIEARDETEAEVELHHQEGGVVLLVAVKVLQRDGLRLSSGIVNVRNVKLLKMPLLVLPLEEMLAPHLEEILQLMITNRGPITLVCFASHSYDHLG